MMASSHHGLVRVFHLRPRSLLVPLPRPPMSTAPTTTVMATRLLPIIRHAPSPHPFTTSAAVAASPAKPGTKTPTAGQFRQKIVSAYKKRAPTRVPQNRRPAAGARKAFRKRIQLSNNSALPVDGLAAVGPDTLSRPQSVGSVVGLSDGLIDSLRLVDAFKPTQTWELFRRPHMLVRRETVELAGRMDAAVATQQALRIVLAGEKIAGKSMLLLQAMTHAFLNGWVVIHIPEAQELVNAGTEYSPIKDTQPLQFSQPVYILKLLQATLKANRAILQQLKPSREYPRLGLHLAADASLADLAAAARDQDVVWPALCALWEELTTVAGRPPVLLAVDGLAHVMRPSAYRDPDFRVVHAHDLALVGLVVNALAGAAPLINGGAVVAATSRGNSPRVPSLDLALARAEARAAGAAEPLAEPYAKGYDARVDAALQTVDVLRLGGVSRSEARAVMDYWAASGLLRSRVTEAVVTEKWSVGGHGNLGEMERAALLNLRL